MFCGYFGLIVMCFLENLYLICIFLVWCKLFLKELGLSFYWNEWLEFENVWKYYVFLDIWCVIEICELVLGDYCN